MAARDGEAEGQRLSELIGALSYALDLTEGQPPGHCVRATWIAVHVGRAMGLSGPVLRDVYYTTMLKDLGCSSNAARICMLYLSDDLALKRDYKTVNGSLRQVLGFVFTHTAPGVGLRERLSAIVQVLQHGGVIVDSLIETRCQRGADIAARLRFPPSVCEGVRALDEHWDGGGRPDRLEGEAIPLPARIALLAQVADVFHAGGGRTAAIEEVRSRGGDWFDPRAVAAFEAVARDDAFWDVLSSGAVEQAVFDLDAAQMLIDLDEDYLDDVANAFAQVIDTKSPFTHGHSERVAFYTDLIAEALGYLPERRRWLRRAALLHDIGKLGVSNAILDFNGPLDDAQRAAVRNHAALSERILERVGAFRDMARIGGRHHERLDGKGYPRGLPAQDLDLDVRIVTVADVFDALTADRPYRAAMTIPNALDILHADAGTAFDPRCIEALECALDGAGLDLNRTAA